MPTPQWSKHFAHYRQEIKPLCQDALLIVAHTYWKFPALSSLRASVLCEKTEPKKRFSIRRPYLCNNLNQSSQKSKVNYC